VEWVRSIFCISGLLNPGLFLEVLEGQNSSQTLHPDGLMTVQAWGNLGSFFSAMFDHPRAVFSAIELYIKFGSGSFHLLYKAYQLSLNPISSLGNRHRSGDELRENSIQDIGDSQVGLEGGG
jgi:hypothetical protein